MTDLIDFLNRENLINLFNKHNEDPDIKSFLESLVEFSKSDNIIIKDTMKFENFFQQINFQSVISVEENMKFLKLFNNPRKSEELDVNLLNKLAELDNKLTRLDDKINYNLSNYPENNSIKVENFQTIIASEFNIISPIKKLTEPKIESAIILHEANNNYSDPYDEYPILALIEYHIRNNNMDKVVQIINWRKKILEVSKNNGWIIGKLLASNTIKKLEVNEFDIIDANLSFMEKFNIIDHNMAFGTNFETEYDQILKDYESQLLKSLKTQ